jgi:hypothetical protein
MGSNNSREQQTGLLYYGPEQYPHYGYGDIENYGSPYEASEEEYSPIYGRNAATYALPQRRRSTGLNRYGHAYPAGYNPFEETLLGRRKTRYIYVPNYAYNFLQQLVQQGGPMGSNGLVNTPGWANANPFFQQNPYGQGITPQGPLSSVSQLSPNCFSVSLQVPSAGAQWPMPIPPPMIQPVIIPTPTGTYRFAMKSNE